MSSPPEIAALAGRFEILGTLGQGGMGTVYRARDLQAQREVALKVLVSVGNASEERFRREGEIAARLHHPGIVRVFSSGVAAGKPWLAYELVEDARSLAEAMEGVALRERVELIRQAAEALEHAHAEGVVHRDVKPDNVLVDGEGRVRVTDFGLAIGLDSERLTKTGSIVGTPYYMAPEQIRGGKRGATPATDVWALGVILYEALTETLPFQGDSLLELAAKICEVRYDPPGSQAEVPEPLSRLCRGALQAKPEDRYASGGAFAADLSAWLEGRRLSSVVAAGLDSGASRVPLIAGGALGAALILGGAFVLKSRDQPHATPTPVAARPSATSKTQSPAEALVAIRGLPRYKQPAALRAFLSASPTGRPAREAREDLRAHAARPLRIFTHPKVKGLAYSFVLLRPSGEIVTSTFGSASRWRLDGNTPLEVYSPASGLALTCGSHSFLGGKLGELIELKGDSTIAEGRKHDFGGGAIARIAGDAEGNMIAIAQHMDLSLRRRNPNGSYSAPTLRLNCKFDISSLAIAPDGSWIAVSGGTRVNTKTEVPSGFLMVLRPSGEVIWKKYLPPRPEVVTLAGGVLFAGTTVGRVLSFTPQGDPLPDLVSPPETSTRASEVQFRGPTAHGSTLRDLRPLSKRRLLSLSGGPGGATEVSEVRLWSLPGGPDQAPLRHLGRLEIRGVCGVSLAVDEERGLFYVGTRGGEIQVWSMEAVLGQRTYNAKANGTGRRTRGS